MAAGRIYVSQYMPCEDANGDRIQGKLFFYANQTTTKQATYTTSALTVENANPVESDAAGVFPAIWADDANTFTVVVTESDGTPLAAYDGLTPSSSISTAALALAEAAADDAEASAASALGAPGTSATSITSLAIGTGAKTFTLAQTGKAFSEGQRVVAASDADATNQMSGIITAFVDPTLTVTMDATAGSGTFADWVISLTGYGAVSSVAGLTGAITASQLKVAASLNNVDNVAVLGKHAIPIPAGAMTARTTNGAAPGLGETTTNRVMRRTLDFDSATIEYAQFAIRMPESWDEGTVTFVPVWSHPSTTTNFGVVWGLQAVALSNDDALDTALGTAQYSTDTGGTTDDVYHGPESAAITIAGTPAAGDWVVFQVLRKIDDASDTMAVDARLHGLTLYITNTAAVDG